MSETSNTINGSFESIRNLPELELSRFRSCSGAVRLPGSKSIGNRSLLLASLARGVTTLRNLPNSDDVRVLMRNLPLLGIELNELRPDDDGIGRLVITGAGGAYNVSSATLNLENAGTALRPLTAILSACSGNFILDGDEQMRKRPIGDLVSALQSLGVEITASEDNTPPVTIKGFGLPPGKCVVSGEVSSQFISALLIAAPLVISGQVIIELPSEPVSKPYIDLTIDMLKEFGVEVERDGYRRFIITGGGFVTPGSYTVEGDASAASYFMALGALPGSGPVTIHGLSRNSIQGDVNFATVIEKMGARIEWGVDYLTVTNPSEKLEGLTIDMNDMPDAAMTLAVLALFAEGETSILNIENLRVKESERIRGLKTELEKLGAIVIEEQSALHINPPEELKSATISTYRDHRMAMAFSIAAYGADIKIENPACVSKTYPNYFRDFFSVTGVE